MTLPARSRGWAMVGICLSVFMYTLDLSIVNVALPTLVSVLHTDFSSIQWVILSYLLVISGALMPVARLGDLYGKKPLYLGGLAVFTAASLLCAASTDVWTLVFFRTLQGAGAVFISALGAALVTEITPPEERGRALGIFGSLLSVGIALGPTVGGLLIGLVSWHWIFLANVPVGILALAVLAKVLPPSSRGEGGGRFDFVGALGFSAALCSFALGMNLLQQRGHLDPAVLALLGFAAVVLPLTFRYEARLDSPLLPARLFRIRDLSLGLGLGVLTFVVMSGSLFLMPFFLELVLGYDTLHVGFLMAVAPVTAAVAAPLSGRLADRSGERPVTLAGLALMVVGCWLISRLDGATTAWDYGFAFFWFGLGIGSFQTPNNSAVMGSLPRDRVGTASGLLSLSRTLGQTTGIPFMAALFALFATSGGGGAIENLPPGPLVAGVHGAFRVGMGLVILALLAAAWLGRSPAPRPGET